MKRTLFYLFCFFITYGSLYPFEFSSQISEKTIEAFGHSWLPTSSIGDILGNIVLFIPFGFFGYGQSLRRLTLIGLLLTFGLQIAQLYLPNRSAALYDVYWNTLGAFIGFTFARLFNPGGLIQKNRLIHEETYPAALILLFWISSQLLPFVPTLDWQSYKNAIKPLLLTPHFVWGDFLFSTTSWIIAAHFAEKIAKKPLGITYLLPGILFLLATKIVIVTNQITLSDLIAGISAAFIFQSIKGIHGKTFLWAGLLLLSYACSALFPFQWEDVYKPFMWLPFSGFLEGSMIINSNALCEKLFVFTAIFLLLKEASAFNLLTVSALVFAIGLIEFCQLWVAGRLAEITDPLLVILIAILVARTPRTGMARPKKTGASTATFTHTDTPAIKARQEIPFQRNKPATYRELEKKTGSITTPALFPFLGLLAWITSVALALYVLGKLSFIPYNVRELISDGSGSFGLSITIFWCFGFPVWFTNKALNSKSQNLGAIWAGTGIHSLVTWMLVYWFAPIESIHDIVGSPVLANMPASVEMFIRFMAFFGVFSLLLFGAVITVHPLLGNHRHVFRLYVTGGISVIVLMPIYYWGVVIQAATDNITELLPNQGYSWSVLFVVLYIVLFTFTGSALSALAALKQSRKLPGIILLALISYPLGFLLLQWGTEQYIMKYGTTFSALQFLLSADRDHYASEDVLKLRFYLLHTAFISMIVMAQFPQWRFNSTNAQ